MRNILNKKLLTLVMVVMMLLAVIVVPVALTNNGALGAELVDLSAEILTEADYGASYQIPTAKIQVGNDKVDATATMFAPDGTVLSGSSVTLNQYGLYKLVYASQIGGVTHSIEKEIYVDLPLFNMSKSTDSFYYGGHELLTGVSGGVLKLTQSGVATYSEVIDFEELDRDEPLIEWYILPKKPGYGLRNVDPDFTYGKEDFGRIIFKFTDIYDPENVITIEIFQEPDQYFCEILTKANNNPLGALLYDTPQGRWVTNGRYGTTARMSFMNAHRNTGRPGVDENAGKARDFTLDWQQFYFDYEELQLLFTNNTWRNSNERFHDKVKVLDYDDTTMTNEAWSGFTDGKAILTVECTEFTGTDPATVMFTKINGKEITSDKVRDTVAPDIIIDFGENYSEDNLPNAIVNTKYPALNYIVRDGNKLGYSTTLKVYAQYDFANGKGASEVTITDGCFTPTTAGKYYVEYVAVDRYGNANKKVLVVEAKDKLANINAGLKDEIVKEVEQGKYVYLPEAIMGGGSGALDVQVFVMHEGSSDVIVPEKGRFLAEKAGKYLVQYYAKDYVGQEYVFHYEITCNASTGPMFKDEGFPEEVILPKYIIGGKKYQLPELILNEYSSGSAKGVKTQITAYYGASTEPETVDGLWTVKDCTAINDAKLTECACPETVTIRYTATANGITEYREKVIPYICIYDKAPETYTTTNEADTVGKVILSTAVNKKGVTVYTIHKQDADGNKLYKNVIDPKAYFASVDNSGNINNAVNKTMLEDGGLKLTFNSDVSIDFINTVMADGLKYDFVPDAIPNYESVTLVLTDKLNAENHLEFTYFMHGGVYITFAVNDGLEYSLTNYNGTIKFNLDGVTARPGGNTYVEVKTFANGAPFTGFSEGGAYATLRFNGVKKESSVLLNTISSQWFDEYMDKDQIAPNAAINGEFVPTLQPGSVLTVLSAIAYDVLDPYSTVTVSVHRKGADGSNVYVKEDGGKELKNLPADREYYVSGLPSDKYYITYSAVDGAGKVKTPQYTVEILDVLAPEISLEKELKARYSVDDEVEIELSDINVTDNKDASITDITLYVINADGIIDSTVSNAEGFTYKFTAKGNYQFVFMAKDAAGNIGLKTVNVTVS
ncbi:MAG: hypothetical protein IKA11_00920 [Clostridia bacterium]|nr:hypothetical protein [Clostridia bacterium]